MKNIYAEFEEIINENETFTILMHNNPDGDSIGSMFAVKRMLEKKNKHVELCIHNYISENFKFWFDKYTGKIHIPDKKSDCLIIVDTPSKEKTYEKYEELADKIIVIDQDRKSVV